MTQPAIRLLEWYRDAGVDELCENVATNHLLDAPPPVVALVQPQMPPATPERTTLKESAPREEAAPTATAIAQARALADNATSLAALNEAISGFDGCSLKPSAHQCVLADGNPDSRVMLIGEAPGAEEDKHGKAFCGPSGQLLDRMFSHIGLTRENMYITNAVFWRPPGDRKPTAEELAICLPFVEKHIALINPTMLILSGGTATLALLNEEKGITRLRGKSYSYTNQYINHDIPIFVMYHPSYLLRQPVQKRVAWQDLLELHKILTKLSLPNDYLMA